MKYRPIVALSLLIVVVVSSIGCITPIDPAESGQLSAVREALGTMPLIDAGEAINTTANNDMIKEFIGQKFTAPNRRSVQAVLVQNSMYTILKPSTAANESSLWGVDQSENVSESPFLWKVDLIERSCSCGSSGKNLYIATALVDPQTGEIVNAKTYTMSENKYGKSTCISACHKQSIYEKSPL
ncbi:MAG: hypothetical protein U9N36_10255 [Euryarchaeota archaeon]|nr:hypothetical protein [Euryarchaeota archaeon]